ncbi:sulfurtransferase complex subunit TusC [Halopseudomonas pelagia]|uniref:sulfurtransferase complex subunit TusC n=1 Tax=Halopseudomonas pelagia TaxID=553151 RepID=UPI0030D89FFB|tara:strand:- start:130016 stop:130369 length:354 start_codon:yes stop_codon:yes gene_type:complete
MKSLLVISCHPPARLAAREALDLVLAAAAFGVPTGLLFMDDGVLQLLKGQDAKAAGQKSLSANLQALELYGVEDVMVCQHSLAARGLKARQCLLDSRVVDSAEIASLLEHYDQVVSL